MQSPTYPPYDSGPGVEPPQPNFVSGAPEHVVSFSTPEVSGEAQYPPGFPGQYTPGYQEDSAQLPAHHHHHHQHPHRKHAKWKRVCVMIVAFFTIIFLGVAVAAMRWLEMNVDIFPTERAETAHHIVFANPAAAAVFFIFLCIAACCHDFFRHGHRPARLIALAVFDIILLGVLGTNGYTLFSLITIDEESILSYTKSFGGENQEIWPKYIPKIHLVTECADDTPANSSNSQVDDALVSCARAYKGLLQLEPPDKLADTFSKVVDAYATETVKMRAEIKAKGKKYIYAIYGVWLGVMVDTSLIILIFVITLLLFNYYVLTNIHQHHHVHRASKSRRKKTGGPNESSTSSDSYSDSLDENFTADMEDKRKAVKRFLLHPREEDSITDIVRIRNKDGTKPADLESRIAQAREDARLRPGGENVGGAAAADGPGTEGQSQAGQNQSGFNAMQGGQVPMQGYDPRYNMQPQFYGPQQQQAGPQFHFITLPGGETRAVPNEPLSQAASQQPLVMNPQITINRSRKQFLRDGEADDEDDDEDDGRRKKKKKKKKGKKKKRKKSKKKKSKKKKKKKGKKKKKKKDR